MLHQCANRPTAIVRELPKWLGTRQQTHLFFFIWILKETMREAIKSNSWICIVSLRIQALRSAWNSIYSDDAILNSTTVRSDWGKVSMEVGLLHSTLLLFPMIVWLGHVAWEELFSQFTFRFMFYLLLLRVSPYLTLISRNTFIFQCHGFESEVRVKNCS